MCERRPKLDDGTIARYVPAVETEGRAPATAQMVIAAVSYVAKLRESSSPTGRLTAATMKGVRRKGVVGRGRG